MKRRRVLGVVLLCMMFIREEHGVASLLKHKKKHSFQNTNATPSAVESGVSTNGVSSVTNANLGTVLTEVVTNAPHVSKPGQDLLSTGIGRPSPRPLVLAVERDDLGSVRRMLAQGVPVDSMDAHGYTPLICAVMNGPVEMVELLLKRGADIDAKDEDGVTALMWGAALGKAETVTSLLKRNPDLRSADKSGKTALMWAEANQHPSMTKLLTDAGLKSRSKP